MFKRIIKKLNFFKPEKDVDHNADDFDKHVQVQPTQSVKNQTRLRLFKWVIGISISLIVLGLIVGLCVYFYQKPSNYYKGSTILPIQGGDKFVFDDYQYQQKNVINQNIKFNYSIWNDQKTGTKCLVGKYGYTYYKKCNNDEPIQLLIDVQQGMKYMMQNQQVYSSIRRQLLQTQQSNNGQIITNSQLGQLSSGIEQAFNSQNFTSPAIISLGEAQYKYDENKGTFLNISQQNQKQKRLLLFFIPLVIAAAKITAKNYVANKVVQAITKKRLLQQQSIAVNPPNNSNLKQKKTNFVKYIKQNCFTSSKTIFRCKRKGLANIAKINIKK